MSGRVFFCIAAVFQTVISCSCASARTEIVSFSPLHQPTGRALSRELLISSGAWISLDSCEQALPYSPRTANNSGIPLSLSQSRDISGLQFWKAFVTLSVRPQLGVMFSAPAQPLGKNMTYTPFLKAAWNCELFSSDDPLRSFLSSVESAWLKRSMTYWGTEGFSFEASVRILTGKSFEQSLKATGRFYDDTEPDISGSLEIKWNF